MAKKKMKKKTAKKAKTTPKAKASTKKAEAKRKTGQGKKKTKEKAGKRGPVTKKKSPAKKAAKRTPARRKAPQEPKPTKPRPAAEDDDVEAPGWDAIDGAFEALYGDQEPLHWGTIIRWSLGGPDPLDGLSAYRVEEPVPHWHLVGYGLSELYEKTSEHEDQSGWGFELTMRLRRKDDEKSPPGWALSVLQNLSRYVATTGNTFAAGHHMDLNGPIALGTETEIRAVAFAEDPELPPLDTPNGKLQFVQVVGLTPDELKAIQRWDATRFLGILERRHPKHVLDLERRSILDDPMTQAEVEVSIEAEGSSMGGVYVAALAWKDAAEGATLELGALYVTSLIDLLRGRTRHSRFFSMDGPAQRLSVTPGEVAARAVDGETLSLMLPPGLAAELAGRLQPTRGRYAWPEVGMTIVVEPTEITGASGDVEAVIG